MKKILYSSILLLTGLLVWSCSDDDFGPIVNLNSAPQITAPTAGTTIELKEAEANDLVPAFSWSAADFGYAAGVTYKLEIDKSGNNFAEAVTLANVNALTLNDLTQAELNNILLAKEFEGETPANLELRVVAKISEEVNTLVSNVVPITVIPYSSTVVIPQLQVPGSYQGWDPANNATIIFSPKSNNQYEGYLYISPNDSKYKFTQGPSWDVNWGDNGNDGSLEPNGADIPAAVEGLYKLNVNLSELTHTQTLTSWGLIGSATPDGWNSDQDMTYDAGTGKLSITLDLIAGEIKFRANDDWAINFGDDGANKTLEYGGANIAVAEAGNYTIDLLIVGVPKYKYTITKN